MYLNSKTIGALIALFVLTMPAALIVTVDSGGGVDTADVSPPAGTASYDPDNVTVVFDAQRLRAMTLDTETPQLYLKVVINGQNAVLWQQVHEGPDIYFEWPTAAMTVPYEPDEPVTVQIEVWQKKRLGIDRPCDIGPGSSGQLAGKTVTLFYDLKRGEWTGDDYLHDGNGYGHLSGFEDGSTDDQDCELWFDIYQMGGGSWWGSSSRLTGWEKEHVYGLNASRNYSNKDFNDDGIPLWWEDKYGFDPYAKPSRADNDPDNDGLTNYQEYRTSQWLSDPFAQDIFIEVDGMKAERPRGEPYTFPERSQQLLLNSFAKHNITVHIDQGRMGGGGDLIPYEDGMTGTELQATRMKYFLHGNENYWRRGVFHYALICHQMEWSGRPAGGRMCYIDMHTIGGQYVRNWAPVFRLQGSNYYQGFASVFMHELGHTLGLSHFPGIDNEKSRFPWNKEYWEWGPYRSCMNYRYVYKLVDYSNGDDEDHDQDDWEHLDLPQFTQPGW